MVKMAERISMGFAPRAHATERWWGVTPEASTWQNQVARFMRLPPYSKMQMFWAAAVDAKLRELIALLNRRKDEKKPAKSTENTL
jgi:hypothetical protein